MWRFSLSAIAVRLPLHGGSRLCHCNCRSTLCLSSLLSSRRRFKPATRTEIDKNSLRGLGSLTVGPLPPCYHWAHSIHVFTGSCSKLAFRSLHSSLSIFSLPVLFALKSSFHSSPNAKGGTLFNTITALSIVATHLYVRRNIFYGEAMFIANQTITTLMLLLMMDSTLKHEGWKY